MEKIPTNPTCRDTEEVGGGLMGGDRPGPLTLKIPPTAEERRKKGEKKEREGEKKEKEGRKRNQNQATLSSGEG